MIDGYRAGTLGKEDVNAAKLQEQKRVNDVDVLIFKKSLLEELLTNELHEMRFPPEMTSLLRTKYVDYSAFRNACGFEDNERAQFKQTVDLTWQGALSKSAFKYGQLIEQSIYGTTFNGAIRQCLKNSKSCEDTLQYGSFGIEIHKIYSEIEKEKGEAVQEARIQCQRG